MKIILLKKIILLLMVILFSSLYKSQKVTVRGSVKDTSKVYNHISVVINDTLRKYNINIFELKNWELLNEKYSTSADKEGNYTIEAKPTDTLYFYSRKYLTQKYKVADIIKNEIKVKLEPEPCIPYVPCEQKTPTNYYIFVGEKVSMKYEEDPYYCNVYSLDDGGIKAVYKIKDQIYGHYPKDTIEFKAYDHYGFPMFGYYDTVLLFVGEYCGKLYHEKYQFFDLYKTKDGRWASTGDPYKFDRYIKEKTIKAQPIEFDPFIRIDIVPPKHEYYPERFQKYEAPYYRLIGDKAVPLMGTYIEDLLKVKMPVFLKEKIK